MKAIFENNHERMSPKQNSHERLPNSVVTSHGMMDAAIKEEKILTVHPVVQHKEQRPEESSIYAAKDLTRGFTQGAEERKKEAWKDTDAYRSLAKTSVFASQEDEETDKENKHWLIDSWPFLGAVYIIIILNSLQMGLATDLEELKPVWETCDHVFTALFTAEMLIKLCVLRCSYFANGWNRLDCFLVSLSIVDAWILRSIFDDGAEGVGDLPVLRILRILRVARIARLLRVFNELWMIIQGVYDSLRALFWVVSLLILVAYTSSILCVSVIGQSNKYPGRSEETADLEEWQEWNSFQYFGSMGRSMYTLFNLIMLTEMEVIGRPLYERQPYMLLFFMGFTIFTSIGVLNVIIGIIVENTMQCAKKMEDEDAEKIRNLRLDKLEGILGAFMQTDEDGNELITLQELEHNWKTGKFKQLFKEVNLPTGWTPGEFMNLLDSNGDGSLAAEEFMKVFYQLLTEDDFQQKCTLHASVNQVKGMIFKLDAKVGEIQENFDKQLKKGLDSLREDQKVFQAQIVKLLTSGKSSSIENNVFSMMGS